jgi:hypothetical protein
MPFKISPVTTFAIQKSCDPSLKKRETPAFGKGVHDVFKKLLSILYGTINICAGHFYQDNIGPITLISLKRRKSRS